MPTPSKKSFYVASTALGLSLMSFAAEAYPPLPNLVNLNFTQISGTPKECFVGGGQCSTDGGAGSADPVGWTGGSGLIFIDGQSPSESADSATYLPTYGDPRGSVSGNYVEADGNPTYESGFNYTVTGLTIGQTYSLSFYQGASEQQGFGLIDGRPQPTTDQWIVALTTVASGGLQISSGGPTDPTYGPTDQYSSTDGSASIVASPLMTVCYTCTVGWDYVTVDLTADATTDLLSFLAWGDNGSTVNLPPIAFLSGVDSPSGLGAVPEPASLTLFAVGMAGLGAVARRHRRKKQPSAS
ncbi:MAG TPA: VPLPA-CTERM sorting domain-containing protein [Acetobacteraceae bacterium]|jgi:hypothetical protein